MQFWIWFGITAGHSVSAHYGWSTLDEAVSASVAVATAFLLQQALRQDEGGE